MLLRPCSSCRRHVREHEQCPFCGAAGEGGRPSTMLAGRLSRAAVFAGATLAGCSSASRHSTPPPGGGDVVMATPSDASTPPPADTATGGFAQPPPPADTGVVATGSAIIKGTVRGTNKALLSYQTVTLQTPGSVPRQAQTDDKGRYEFTQLPAGSYTVSAQSISSGRYRPPPARVVVEVADKETKSADLVVEIYVAPVDHGPCCKPYGAPPARRRVV